jgi:hypothetical protein
MGLGVPSLPYLITNALAPALYVWREVGLNAQTNKLLSITSSRHLGWSVELSLLTLIKRSHSLSHPRNRLEYGGLGPALHIFPSIEKRIYPLGDLKAVIAVISRITASRTLLLRIFSISAARCHPGSNYIPKN